MIFKDERSAFQAALFVAAFVPIGGGAYGVLTAGMNTHYAYLSGILFAIGIAFWSCVRHVERRGKRMALLVALVFCGGLMRLLGALWVNTWGAAVLLPLVMEICVAPLMLAWQWRIARAWQEQGVTSARID